VFQVWLTEHNRRIQSHFERLAENYLQWKDRNRFYNQYLIRWCRSVLPPGEKVLDVGSGRGDVLAAVAPREGLGIDLSEKMVALSSRVYPNLRFVQRAIEDFEGDASYDAALLINTLEYTYDVGCVLGRIHSALRDGGRLLITTANPLWSTVFRMASAIGWRIPECERLFVTNEDVVNMLRLHGFEVVYKAMALALPKPIPIIGSFLNWVLARTPYVRFIGSTQLVLARKTPPARREYSVSIVIPCHNERDGVEECVKAVPKFGTRTELIFVDDGSTDGTSQAIKPELNPDIDIKVLSYSPNRGKGHAVKVGFDSATGDIVAVLDADLTTHPEELGPIYEAFATGRAEFVNCTRLVYPMQDRAMKFTNFIGNKMFTLLVSAIMGARVSDTLCGTKAMFRRDYQHMIMGRDPWGDYDFLFGAAQLRLVIRELPVHYRERTAGVSKMKSLRHTINLLRMLVHGFLQVQVMRPIGAQRAFEEALADVDHVR
jgi:ubiquinone/menaquinone biosynthesis C-methylase UbiE